MLDPKFVIAGAVISVYGCAVYALDTLRGNTRPNRVSWLMWTIAPLIVFAAQFSQGVSWQSLLAFSTGFGPLLILIASFADRKAYWDLDRIDIASGIFSALALVLWALTRSGNLAIVFGILADLIAAIPTLRKSYSDPASEHAAPFLASIVAAVITMLTITNWTFAVYAWPVYIVFIAGAIAALILFPNLRLRKAAA